MQVSELLTELRHFYCTQNYYRHWLKCLVYTDGVKFLADEANCYWLGDAIASHQPEIKRISQLRQHQVFQTWRLELDPKPMMLSCFDGQGVAQDLLIQQEVVCTDFPLKSFKLYCHDGVLMLPSEY